MSERGVAIVTGGSGSIGAAICRALARDGWTVHLTYQRQRERAEALAKEIRGRAHQVDVTSRKHVRGLMVEVGDPPGPGIGALVCTHGINRTADWNRQTDEEWSQVLDVNLRGAFLACQEAGRRIQANGRIVLIGSLSADTGGPRSPAYAAAKAGLLGLTRCFARNLAPQGVTVNQVSPGVIDNAFTGASMADWVRRFNEARRLIDRWGTPEDVAAVVAFLLSPGAGWVAGQELRVNGGASW